MSSTVNETNEHTLKQLNQIIQIQSILAQANFDVNGFMNLVVEQVQQLTQATGVVIELVEGDEMVYKAATGSVKSHIGLRLSRKNSISGLSVSLREILRSDDTEKDSRVNVAACRLVGARSMIVTPLLHQGEAVGVLKIMSDKANGFTNDDMKTLQIMAGLIGAALMHQIFHATTEKLLTEKTKALENLKQAEKKLMHMANYDMLTDLPNRNFFIERLHRALKLTQRNNKCIALLFLDIDHFKSINDTLGHAVGDELLKAFALRVKQSIRETDIVARFGGDEFVVLLEELHDNETALRIADNIIAKMQIPFAFRQKQLTIGTSIGIAYYSNNISPDELLRQADTALYHAKHKGRNNYQVFNENAN